MQYALDHPALSLTLESPVSPYGFGGTRRDGTRLTDDDAGCGGGVANPDFVQRLIDHDTTRRRADIAAERLPVGLCRSGIPTEHEDVWVESMLTTSTATGNYPGDSVAERELAGLRARARIGVLNTMAPRYFDVSAIVDLAGEAADPLDPRHPRPDHLGHVVLRLQQPRAARHRARTGPATRSLRRSRWCRRCATSSHAYADAGGEVTERSLEGVGHTPHLERPAEFRHALLEVIGYVGHRARPRTPDRGDHPPVGRLTAADAAAT